MKKLFLLLLFFSLSVFAAECPTGMPMKKAEKCYSCSEMNLQFSKEECDKCSEFRKFEGGLCVFTRSPYPDRPLISKIHVHVISWKNGGRGYTAAEFSSCDDLDRLPTSPENCSVCANRKFEKNWCVLKECPLGYFPGSSGNCFKCSTTGLSETGDNYEISKENCDRCPEREYKNGKCILKTCPENAPIRSNGRCLDCSFSEMNEIEESECYKCLNREYKDGKCLLKCGQNKFRDAERWCKSCDSEKNVKATIEECNKCSNREMYNGYCSLKCPEHTFRTHFWGENECSSCGNLLGFKTEKENCDRCLEREYKDGQCILKECPKEYPVSTLRGCVALSCDGFDPIETTEEVCALCPNREYKNGKCISKECPIHYFHDEDGFCRQCPKRPGVLSESNKEKCNKCLNREYINGTCAEKCLENTFRDMDIESILHRINSNIFMCALCSEDKFIKTTKEECDKCSNREYVDNLCWKKCEKNEFRDHSMVGGCWKCDSVTASNYTSLEECQKCPNREYKDGKCILKDCPQNFPKRDHLMNCVRR